MNIEQPLTHLHLEPPQTVDLGLGAMLVLSSTLTLIEDVGHDAAGPVLRALVCALADLDIYQALCTDTGLDPLEDRRERKSARGCSGTT